MEVEVRMTTWSPAKALRPIGGFIAMSLDTFRVMFKRPFQLREFLEQTWFISRVAIGPTIMLTIPFLGVVIFLINQLLAQIGGILAYASEPFDASSSLMYFLGIDKAKFRRPVTPGDRLDLEVAVVHHRTNVWKFRGEASVDGTLCASAELLASVVDRAG